MSSHGFVGDLLIRAGLVDAAGLALALEAQSRQMTTIGRALASLGLATESAVAEAIAAALHLECFDGDPVQTEATMADVLPSAFCRKYGVAPLGYDGNCCGSRSPTRWTIQFSRTWNS